MAEKLIEAVENLITEIEPLIAMAVGEVSSVLTPFTH